jgi:RND superfamily putative drug exporter
LSSFASSVDLAKEIIKRRIMIILIWAIVLIALIPAMTGYTHYISYSTSSGLPSNSESMIAQHILEMKMLDNSSLIIVLQEKNESLLAQPAFAEQVINFQDSVSNLHIKNFSSTYSEYSSYAQYINSVFNSSDRTVINATLTMFNDNATEASLYLMEHGYNITPELIIAINSGQNPGLYYVEHYGTEGIPSFLSTIYSAKDVTLIIVTFNVKAGTILSNGETASELAFPSVNSLARQYFGSAALVTGNGAIAYETSQETARAAFAFGLIFVFLAIAVLFSVLSWKSSILVFIFSGLALLLGYVSEYIAGLIFHGVSFIVNYTLTAVILGISADYLLFIISRYRDELRAGNTNEDALNTAISRSGKSIVISGLTVATSLLAFYFIPGFHSWGITLFLSVIFTILLETTLLPAVVSLFGPKLFIKFGMKSINEESIKSSKFYKMADFSVKKKFAVVAIFLLIGSLGVYSFLTVPTTYNFNTGLPQKLEAVKGLNVIDNSFGENQLYPVYVIVNIKNVSNTNATLRGYASYLESLHGVSRVVGPYANINGASNYSDISEYLIENTYVYYTIYINYSPYSNSAINLVKEIRSNSNFIVGGVTSSIIDEQAQNSVIYGELEILIIAAIAIIIGISFRSWKYPLISLTGVLFSVSWATMVLYFISIYLLHEQLIYLIPIILFIILFSLGNDYTVFIISRVNEEAKKFGLDNGIRRGLASSGKVVSALGIILAVSLGSLTFIPVAFLEQLGIAFIISLIIDTFIIRPVYFPAMIALLFDYSKKS